MMVGAVAGHWAPRLGLAACVKCGTTAVPHHAHGLCDRCHTASFRGGRCWPHDLVACLHCGKGPDEAGYQGRGLCHACYRTHRDDYPKRYGSTRLGKHQGMVLALAQRNGGRWLANELPAPFESVRRWARGAPVPRRYVPRLDALWRKKCG